MQRRNFIKKSGLGLSTFFIFPTLLKSAPASSNIQLLPLTNVSGQIRHGALSLPQVGFNNELIAFDWLHDVSRNIFFQNGFLAGGEEEDMEITSMLLNQSLSIQVQRKSQQTTLLIGDKEWVQAHQNRGVALLKEEEDLAIYFGSLEMNQPFIKKINTSQEAFIYVLKGDLTVNNIALEPNVGLGLKESAQLDFNIRKESQFIGIIRTTE